MFIAIEGSDGCGKTTLCKEMSSRLNAVSYSTPPKKYMELRERVDKKASADEHFNFYRDGIYDASDEINLLLKNGNSVVSDRYWLSTYTYHQIMGVCVSVDDFKSIVKPDLTIILTLNHKVQIDRMLKRGMSAGDRRLLDKQQEISLAFYKNSLEFNIPFISIDTQHFTPEKCVEIILKSL